MNSPRPRPKSASFFRSALSVLLSLLIFIAAGEVVMRWYLRSHIVYDVEMVRYALKLKAPSPDPGIGHVHRPGRSARLMGVDVRINSDGLRDREHPVLRDNPDTARIALLGDSIAFGWGVREEENFASLLEEELSRKAPAEVINFGTGNYNTAQEVGLFLEKGLFYKPDKVAVFYFLNDAEPTPSRSRLSFLGHSRFITFYWSRLRAAAVRLRPSQGFQNYYSALYGEGQPGWEETRSAFRRLRDVCREEGSALQVVLLPDLHRLDTYPFEREHRLVGDFLRGEGIDVLDLAPLFSGEKNPQRLWVASDDAHPNALGHRLIAEHTFPFIAQ